MKERVNKRPQEQQHSHQYPLIFVVIIIVTLIGLSIIHSYTEQLENNRRLLQRESYMSGNRFMFTKIGVSFLIPDPAKSPITGGLTDSNALIPLPDNFPSTSKFTVETAVNSTALPLEKLDEITYGYERLSPERFIEENETIRERHPEQIGNNPALTLLTTTEDTAKYYTFLQHPGSNPNGSLVYAFILSIPSASESTISAQTKEVIQTLISSIQFFQPNR